MAKLHPNSRANLRPHWVPGRSGNPGGKPMLTPELKAITSLTRREVCKIISKYARMTSKEFEEAKKDPLLPKIHACVMSLLDDCHVNQNYTPMAFLLDRAVGKATDDEVDQEEAAEAKQLEEMSETDLIALAKKKIAEFEAA